MVECQLKKRGAANIPTQAYEINTRNSKKGCGTLAIGFNFAFMKMKVTLNIANEAN